MLMKQLTTQKEIFMTNYVTLFNDLTIDRYSTNSEWETVKETFLHNLRTTIQCIRSGKAQKAPFVRMVAKDGDVSRAFEGFAFCYAKDRKTKKPHAFPNRFIKKNGFAPVTPKLADDLDAMMKDSHTMEMLLDDLKATWESKVANGQKGRAQATANVAHFSSTASFKGSFAVKAA